ncbi:response regulator transcription factor [Alkaliphilus peptidifermentans]|uniref:Stage 0 sporulation protein A homolog n=1 Tax=Alkaliphilus peptidifermentans DSM 18978 TaxID=1120976 RepID=A0A1G5AUV3_9FIRM|nr:helix-turn-helix domain-containing protein [Alkaliphilus peptidifermentans]SCX81685.1 two-component system, response regulator YesN [Alkaliphilus peptidifermentans DSM 18978]
MVKVIIVEDEQLIRKGMVLTIPWEQFDCEVVGECANGLIGKEMIERLKPDIVITDVKMPKMDGIVMIQEVVDKVDAEYIIISGYSDFQYAQQAVRLGVKDYLLKPVEDKELFYTLNRIVENIKDRKEQQRLKNSTSYLQQCQIQFFNEYLVVSGNRGKEKYVIDTVNYIKEHYKEDITIKIASEVLYISESYLSRLFKKETGYTFVEYLTNYRMKKAIKLLVKEDMKIFEVADAVGYSDSRYFSALFKKCVGITPTEVKEGQYEEFKSR